MNEVLERPAAPAVTTQPSAADRLASVRAEIAATQIAMDRDLSEAARCDTEAAGHQNIIDREAQFADKLVTLHQAAAAGDAKAAKQIPAAELDAKETADMAARAKPATQGAQAAASKFRQSAADLKARLAQLRHMEEAAVLAQLDDGGIAVSAEHLRWLEEVVCSRLTETYANIVARAIVCRERGIDPVRLTARSAFDPYLGEFVFRLPVFFGAGRNERETIRDFDLRDRIEARAGEIAAQLRKDLGLQ